MYVLKNINIYLNFTRFFSSN